jgi:phosphate transport system substrate-binding protein
MAYYEAHKDKLRAVAIKGAKSENYVLPSPAAVLSKEYVPLSRPLFIYVKKDSLKRPEVQEFGRFYMRRSDIVETVKYVPLSSLQQAKEKKKLEEALKVAGN